MASVFASMALNITSKFFDINTIEWVKHHHANYCSLHTDLEDHVIGVFFCGKVKFEEWETQK